MKEVLYNNCYGGFEISALALKKYLEIVKPELKVYAYKENYDFNEDKKVYTRENDIQNNREAILTTKDLGDQYISKDYTLPGQIYLENYCYGSIRTDKNLIKIVKELGDAANGAYSKLAIAQVEGKYRICEYDGYEWVETPESIEWEE